MYFANISSREVDFRGQYSSMARRVRSTERGDSGAFDGAVDGLVGRASAKEERVGRGSDCPHVTAVSATCSSVFRHDAAASIGEVTQSCAVFLAVS